MQHLKIAFLLAKNSADVDWYRPLAFGYLKSYLERFGCDAQMQFCEDTSAIAVIKPDIVAVSTTTASFKQAQEIGRLVKEYDKKIVTILGGHHITYLPHTLPDDFDFGVIGEAEQTFLELINAIAASRSDIDLNRVDSISGLIFRRDGRLVQTAPRSLIDPIDTIPIPHRDPGEKAYLFTSRGCPYKCIFCSSSAFWRKARFFSAQYVVDEIESIRQQSNASHISIWDDLFIADKKRLKEIVVLLQRRGLTRHISFDCAVRANLVTDELCELLKEMNVTAVGFGAESASDRILQLLHKGTTAEINQAAIDTLNRHGFTIGCSFIVGCPTETEEDVVATYEFFLKNAADGKISPASAVNILSPMPGTALWNEAIGKDITADFDYDTFWPFSSYRNSKLSFADWVALRRKNGTIYLANDSLPQERLYELMAKYESRLGALERQQTDSTPNTISGNTGFNMQTTDSMAGKMARKITKAIYFAFTDFTKFRTRLSMFLHRHAPTAVTVVKTTTSLATTTFPKSATALKYCVGKGIEIGGSAHNPFGLDVLNVDYTDSMETVFKKDEVLMCGEALKVDIVAPGDNIPLPDATKDFVVSSHVFEHFCNPIKALLEWDRIIKVGGVIFMIVPHKERTFDKPKPRTPLEHIVNDYRTNNTQFHNDPHGHDHVWITEDVVEIVQWTMANCGVHWEIVEVQDTDDKVGNGFTIVIRKTALREVTAE